MEITINGQLTELGNSMPAITKKSIDVNSPSTRFIDYTNKFKLPDTVKNREIFDSPQGIGTNNRSFDKLYDVVLKDVFQIFRGKGFLDSSDKDSFSFQLVDNSKELFKALDIKLRSINWDDKDTILTTTAIDALDAIDISTCWFWGKACYHENALIINTDQTVGDARCLYSRPAFYVQGLLNRAVTLQGYIFSTPIPDLAFSSCHDQFFFTSYEKTLAATYNPAGTLALSGLDTNDFEHADLTVTSTTIAIAAKSTKFRIRGSVTSDAIVNMIIRATDNVDGTKVSESKLIIGIGTQIVDFESSDFQSDDGNTIDIRFEGTGAVTFDAILYTLLSDETEDLSTNPWLGYRIKAYDNLPDLTYLDLFRLICVTSNKYHIVDTYAKTFAFGSLANLNKMNSVDWSDKFVIDSESITSKFSGLYQKNYLKYENDLSVNPELGWSYFETDNESLAIEGDYMILKFGASNEVLNDIAHIPIYNYTTRIPDQEIKIRLFAMNVDKLEFGSISWSGISSSYYSEWFNSLYRIRQINANFNLSKLDVLSWHEKQLVYIDYFKTTFIVLEIGNFIPGRLTKVKLLSYGR